VRIVLIGQAAFAEKVLQTLVDKGKEVVGVYMPRVVSSKPTPLEELAGKLNIPFFKPARMRDPAVFDEYVKLKPDLNVMAFVTDIIPETILRFPRFETIQYHPSLLPKHRGASSINWAVIQGDKKTGLTIFWPDKGLDTGPVLLQKEVNIAPDDTVGSIYFNKLFPLGVEAILESIELVEKGAAPRIQQDESLATYEGICTEKEAVIDWSQPVDRVYDFIRGNNPQPGATTHFLGKKIKIFDSQLAPARKGAVPGEVVDVNKSGFAVAAHGGAILVKRVQPDGSPKMSSEEFVQQTHLKTGDKLGN
jgi:methionyl-tRNA formyltransferase